MEALLLLLAAVLVLAPVVSLVVALVTKSRLTKLEERAGELERANGRLEKHVLELRAELRAPRAAPAPKRHRPLPFPSPLPSRPGASPPLRGPGRLLPCQRRLPPRWSRRQYRP